MEGSNETVVLIVPEGLELLTMDAATIENLWKQFNRFPKLFLDHERGRQDLFVKQLLSPTSVYFGYNNLGVIYYTDILLPYVAKFHVMFWDKKLRDKREVCLNALDWGFNVLKVNRIWTSVPSFAKHQKAFAESLGFKREGYLRAVYPCQGVNYDAYVFGILREEWDHGKSAVSDERGRGRGVGTSEVRSGVDMATTERLGQVVAERSLGEGSGGLPGTVGVATAGSNSSGAERSGAEAS